MTQHNRMKMFCTKTILQLVINTKVTIRTKVFLLKTLARIFFTWGWLKV